MLLAASLMSAVVRISTNRLLIKDSMDTLLSEFLKGLRRREPGILFSLYNFAGLLMGILLLFTGMNSVYLVTG